MGIVERILENHVVVDFETYFKDIPGDPEKYTLSSMTTPEYVHDPRFLIHGVAVQVAGEKASFFASSDLNELSIHLKNMWCLELPVVMHNAYFDDYIMCNLLGICCSQVIDTQGLALAILGNRKETGQSTSLKALAGRLGLQPKGDLTYMNGKRTLSPSQQNELGVYACGDAEITSGILRILLPLLSAPERELAYMHHTIRLFTGPGAGARVSVPEIDALRYKGRESFEEIFTRAGVTEDDVSKDTKFRHLMAAALRRTERELPMKAGKNGPIPALAKTDPAMQDLLDDEDPAVAALAEARLAKKSLDQFERRLDSTQRIVALTDGRLPLYLQYHGAHTGRTTGGDGLNQLNLGKEGLQGDIRGLYRARPGHVLVIGDASQIEARITAWLAGQDNLIEGFRNGDDVYLSFAEALFRRRLTKEENKKERTLGKVCILGLGFGMGVGKLLATLQRNPDLAPFLASGELSMAQVRNMHELYREMYPEIPYLWQTFEADLRELVLTGCPFGYRVDLGWDTVCGVRSAFVRLPSGRKIQYPRLRLEYQPARKLVTIGRDGQLRGATVGGQEGLVYGNHGYLYGGKITENIVQGIARDILYGAVLDLEAMGHRVLFHVYDEIILEVPDESAEKAKRDLEERLSRPVPWAFGLPLAAEALVSGRYCKA